MKSVHDEIVINAPPERVWQILTDFAAFPRWNPFIREARGRLRPGARLLVRLKIVGPRPSSFRPTVRVVDPPHELRWLARTGRPGVFDVERSFRIVAEGDGGSRLIQHESCTGVLAPLLFAAGIGRPILRGYRAMNAVLKARAEGSVP